MIRYSLTGVFVLLVIYGAMSQQKWVRPDTTGRTTGVHTGSALYNSPLEGTIEAQQITENWDIRIEKPNSIGHISSVPQHVLDSLRSVTTHRPLSTLPSIHHYPPTDTLAAPALARNFRGNQRDNSVPLDNTLAVSDNGFLVSGINTNIMFAGPDGNVTYSRGLADFFTLLGLGSRMYDPRVIYDTEQRRFIFMCLHGSEPSNTFLCLAFSKTEDPNGEWNYYKIDGNPDGDNNWFDYPNIAISKQELFISGLMRNTDGNWQYTVLYQIDKMAGFTGMPLVWKHYNEIKDADGKPSFNLVPTPSGWSDLSDGTMFFVSNEELGGDTYNLHYTSGSLAENPVLRSIQSKGPATELAPYGRQNSTVAVLNTFDSRLWSALYLNGTIHMGSHIKTPTGEVGLFYARMDVQNGSVTASLLNIPGKDIAYPSFSAFGTSPGDDAILINYLISGPDIYPSQELRICKGTGNTFEWSAPVTLRSGISQVDFLTGNLERWGDYTTSSRRFLPGRVESWVTGCFGESRSYGTWVGQLHPETETKTKVLAEFTADKTTTRAGEIIQFTDLTPNKTDVWKWHFEKGTPGVSQEQHPRVSWAENGSYDVTLMVRSERGTDTLVKKSYIHITDPITKPVTDFTQDRDTIYKDEEVRFYDKSTANAVTFKWTFQNGSPGSSTDKNPVVRYTKAGSFLVSLTTANIAGSNTKIRQKAVTVLERTIPEARFQASKTSITAGDSILFTEESTGGATSWNWLFEGGTPATSADRNPTVVYTEEGRYAVQLIAENEKGKDTLVRQEYIEVGVSSVQSTNALSTFNVYPNPAGDGDIHLMATIAEAAKATVVLYTLDGRLVKTILDEKVQPGTYRITWNGTAFPPGMYSCHLLLNGERKGVCRLVRQ